jgi:hypothetical protein
MSPWKKKQRRTFLLKHFQSTQNLRLQHPHDLQGLRYKTTCIWDKTDSSLKLTTVLDVGKVNGCATRDCERILDCTDPDFEETSPWGIYTG